MENKWIDTQKQFQMANILEKIEKGKNQSNKKGNTNIWYIATCTKKNDDGTYEMDHLHRVDNCSDFKWKHPAKVDLDNLKLESIMECHINGKWDVSKEHART